MNGTKITKKAVIIFGAMLFVICVLFALPTLLAI